MFDENAVRNLNGAIPLLIPFGKSFVLTMEDQPIELQINACLTKAHYFDYGLRNADDNYQFLVFKVRGHNLGRRLVLVELMDGSEVLVDRGYAYGRIIHPSFALRPEEFAVGYAVFEILSTVKPVEVTWKDPKRDYLINLRDAELREFYSDLEAAETDH